MVDAIAALAAGASARGCALELDGLRVPAKGGRVPDLTLTGGGGKLSPTPTRQTSFFSAPKPFRFLVTIYSKIIFLAPVGDCLGQPLKKFPTPDFGLHAKTSTTSMKIYARSLKSNKFH